MRRYSAMKASRGTVIPKDVRAQVMARDNHCVGIRVGMPQLCAGSLELDHVRASHGIGLKSRTTADNLVVLCGAHHRLKTEHGKEWRPVLLAYLERVA